MPAEAYATLVYGDGPLACAAAILGHTLKLHDPRRARVALVRDISVRTRAILEHGDLWTLHEQSKSKPKRRYQGSPRYRQQLQRKNELWKLPFERVLYMDADTFILPDPSDLPGLRARRLDALWQSFPLSETDALLAATGVRPNHYRNLSALASTCFNGGFLLLRPSAESVAKLEGIDPHAARHEAEASTGRRCPGFDQPLLNAAFPAGTWSTITDANWRSLTHWMASPEQPSTCGLRRRQKLLRHADAYHFFHKVNPWENVHCALCVEAGMRCRPVVPVGLECPVQALAQAIWWREGIFGSLPRNATRACLELADQSFVGNKGRPLRPRDAKLRAGLCTGCANRATPACVADEDVDDDRRTSHARALRR